MSKELFAEVIVPLAVKGRFSYRIPEKFRERIRIGSQVLVEFGSRKIYTAVVTSISEKEPELGQLKDIIEMLDTKASVNQVQITFWLWMSEYYMCSPGEVMRAALPPGLCLESESVVSVNEDFTGFRELDEDLFMLFNLIAKAGKLQVRKLPGIINGKNSLKLLNTLVIKNAVISAESFMDAYSAKSEKFIVMTRKYTDSELGRIMDSLAAAPVQLGILTSYLRLTGYTSGSDLCPVRKSLILKEAKATQASANSLEKKGIILTVSLEVSRLEKRDRITGTVKELSKHQEDALTTLYDQLSAKEIVLLHGVTSSGKTELYIKAIEGQLKKGKQVLYLLPEIALTTQITSRITSCFGNSVTVYHSRLPDKERIEIWDRVSGREKEKGFNVIIGARSALFLPFHNLGLVIVDEEHDGSYKQHDPAPRYNARDSAIMLASLSGAVTVLGSATPSVESMFNAASGKYGYVRMDERYGKVNLPEIIVANTSEAGRKKLMVSHFSPQLLELIDDALEKNEQVMLFRNRRGYSPYLQCTGCGWIPTCTQCSVNLTYHKELNRLVCHYCGSSYMIPVKCGSCGNISVVMRGYGTEKLEEEIKIVFPGARVARMDQDSTRKRHSFQKIISDFEKGDTDILIGTQMISKSLDFENLTVVGILNADALLNFPDFRAHERAFQMMSQVSGRAGRRQKHGRVVIQTSDPSDRVIRFVLNNDYRGMYESQIGERRLFNYPPFCRIIRINLKHKDKQKLNEFSSLLAKELREAFGNRVLGPEFPVVSRIQLWYIKSIVIKIEKEKPVAKARELIRMAVAGIEKIKGSGSLRVNIDVDPY
ncbi:MAG TPA: primosomal protein N' [Bacteroidales bacterium]|nr:primosomal protein N' [Bacteroidales bacterium]